MKLSLLNENEIPPIPDDQEEDDNDMEGVRKDIDFRKKFVHKPQQAMGDEEASHHPTSPVAFVGAAPTR